MAYFKYTDEGIEYCYERVADTIPLEYANSENIDKYLDLDNDSFTEIVTGSYAHFDGSKDNDCSRALAKMTRLGAWLKKNIMLYESKQKKEV